MNIKDILIVEDDKSLTRIMELELNHENYSFDVAKDGYEAMNYFENNQYSLILLDIMLPGISGMEVCRRIRKTSNLPIIMLTARQSIADKVTGLDLGADDYITKPFEMEELLARIRAGIRKGEVRNKDTKVLTFKDLSLDLMTRTVKRKDNEIVLTKTEFDLLKYLLFNKGQVLTREQLLNQVWGYDYYGSTNVLDVYIRYLRNKIDYPFDTETIHTVRGVGYCIR